MQAEDLGEDSVSYMVIPRKLLFKALMTGKPKLARRLFDEGIWKPGSLRLLSIPGLRLLYRLKRFLFF